jgi:glucuronoarabinoxylan endo-1,4-beta-xylanase
VDILGVHQYDSQVAEPWPADVPDKKPVWQTEMSGVKYWPEEGPSTDINNGVVVAGWVHNALTVGDANAWLWWWYNGTSTNEGLYNNGTDTKRHYTFGNFTKFIRPGYVRVEVTGNSDANLLLSAYRGSDGTVVIVAINKGTTSASVPISITGGTAPTSLTPWVTSASDNLASKTAVSVSGGTFTASLASKTVTTFVGK